MAQLLGQSLSVRASDGAIFGTPHLAQHEQLATATPPLMAGTGSISIALDGQTPGLRTNSAIGYEAAGVTERVWEHLLQEATAYIIW